MKKKKILVLMEVLTTGERQHFLRWLRAELNGNQQIVMELANLLIGYSSGIPDMKKIHDSLVLKYPKIKINFTKYTSILTQYIEYFIASKALKKKSSEIDILLLEELNNRKPLEALEQTVRRVERKLVDELPSKVFFRKSYELSYAKRAYEIKSKSSRKEEALIDMNMAVDGWWLYQKIVLLNTRLIDELLYYQRESTFQQLDADFAQWKLIYSTKVPYTVLEIYAQMFVLLRRREETEIDHLLDLFYMSDTEHQSIDVNDLKNMFNLLLNYFIHNLNRGKKGYEVRIMKLYKWGFEHKLVYQGKYLLSKHYQNYINISLRHKTNNPSDDKKDGEILSIIEKYKNALSPKAQGTTYILAKANYYYKNKEFTEVVDLLKDWKSVNAREYLIGNTYLIESRYELGSMDSETQIHLIENLIKNTRKKHQLSKRFRAPYLLRFRFLIHLLKAYYVEDYKALRKQVEEAEDLPNQDWFLDKIEEVIEA